MERQPRAVENLDVGEDGKMDMRPKIIRMIGLVEKAFAGLGGEQDKLLTLSMLKKVMEQIYPYVTVKTYDILLEKLNDTFEFHNSGQFTFREFGDKFEETKKMFYEFKNDYENNITNKVKISFAIPSARATFAKKAALAILEYEGDEIEVVVSHSCYHEMTGEDTVEIDDERFKYYPVLEPNKFSDNVLNVISKASGDYVFILSDKDIVNIRVIPFIISAVQNNRDVVALWFDRGVSQAPPSGDYTLYKKGDNALYSAYIKFMMTGIIYKKSAIDLDYFYAKNREGDYAYSMYVHVFILLDLCTKGDYIEFKDFGSVRPLANEEYPIFPRISSEATKKNKLVYPSSAYTLENRLKVFRSFSELIIPLIKDEKTYIDFQKGLIRGYFVMCTYNMYLVYPEQRMHEINISENAEIFKKECISLIDGLVKNREATEELYEHVNFCCNETVKFESVFDGDNLNDLEEILDRHK